MTLTRVANTPAVGSLSDASQLNQLIDLFSGGQVYDVAAMFGQGASDDVPNIQSVVNTAGQASGGDVVLRPGQWNWGSGLVIPYDNVRLRAMGWGTVLKLKAGFTGTAISTTQPASNVRLGLVLSGFKMDCSLAASTARAIDLWGTYFADIRDLWIYSPQAMGIYVDRAVGSSLPSAYNEFRNVHITNGKAIGYQSGGGANSGSEFQNWFGGSIEWCGGNGSGNTAGIGANCLGNMDQFHGTTWDANDTNVLMTQVRGYRFELCTFDRAFKNLIRVVGGDNHRFVHCKGGDFVPGVLANQSQSAIELDGGTHDNWVDGFLLDSNSTLWAWAFREFSGVGPNFFGGIDTKGVPMNLWIRANLLPNSRFGAVNKPSITNGAALGSSPPAAAIIGTNFIGQVSLGTGTGPAAGKLCTVAYSTAALIGPFSGLPFVSLSPASAGGAVKTANLGLSVRNQTTDQFEIWCETAPSASQAGGTYLINYRCDWGTAE